MIVIVDYNKDLFLHIEEEDMWSLDHTLSRIIAPVLQHYRKVNNGSPTVDDEDVPDDIRPLDVHERFNWVLDEMIAAHMFIADGHIYDATLEQEERVKNGLRLFGKYYLALWT